MNTDLPQIDLTDHHHRPLPGLEQALDFVNTTGLSRGKPFEELGTAAAAVEWLERAGYLSAEAAAAERKRLTAAPARAETALRGLRATRSGLRELVDALAEERAPRGDALRDVNAALGVRETVQLVASGARVRIAHSRDGEPFDQTLAAIARTIAEEVSEGRPDRFRICQNDTCRWAFYDSSRPGTRRWCEMASCGNRMKAARHRARQRAAPAQ
jgi:predicted RNA-binding Zn ribbon-like protein